MQDNIAWGCSGKTNDPYNVPRHMLQEEASSVYTCDAGKDIEGTTFDMTHHITVSQPVTLHLLWAFYSMKQSVRCPVSATL